MDKLKLRLEILKNSSIIDEQIYEELINFMFRLRDKWEIELTEENGAMMITHIAMALKRIKNGEPVSKIDENVYIEVLKSDKLDEIEKIYEDISENIFKEEIPEEEKKYIYVNLLIVKDNQIEDENI